MRLFIIISFLLLGLLSANARQHLVIKGTVEGDLNGFRKVYFTDFNFTDSVEIRDGKFSWQSPKKSPALIYTYAEYHSKGKNIFAPTPVLSDRNDTVLVHYDLLKAYRATIAGKGEAASFIEANDGWVKVSPQRTGNGTEATPEQEAFLTSLVKKRPDAYSTVFFLEQSTSRLTPSLQEQLFKGLSAKARTTDAGNRMNDRLLGYKNSVKGAKVIGFSLKDSAGKTHSIRDYEGKIVIVDFWASWCGPCRASFPHLKALYEQYHSKGLEIISISIDEKRPDWLQAVKEEQLPWAQLLDDQGLALKGFAVTAIPHLFLLDKDGKFIFQQLGNGGSSGPLEERIKSLLNEGK